jgi:hypothetical protein
MWDLVLDSSDGGLLVGWVIRRGSSDDAVVLEVSSTSGNKITAIADVLRLDLIDAGKGKGRNGFEIDIRDWDRTGQTVTIRPEAEGGELAAISVSFDLATQIQNQQWFEKFRSLMKPLSKRNSL